MTAPPLIVVVHNAHGPGAQAMPGPGSLISSSSIAWPTAAFAGMKIEGTVKLGYCKELMAIADPATRLAEFQRMTAEAYDTAKAVMGGGIDNVIDPAATRQWIVNGLKRLPPVPVRTTKKYPYVDTW